MAAQAMIAKEPARQTATEAAQPVRVPDVPESSKGLLAMLERHRAAEARLGTDYMEAVSAGDEVRASFLLSQWSNMGERLRALEKIAPRALEEMGIYVRKDDVRRELEPLHRSILKTFQQQLRLARPRLKQAATPEEWNQLVDEVVEEAARMLTETDFREPLELETEVVA
jgi:hypothetical protein